MGAKGAPKTGGRKKNTPNKQTAGVQAEIEARLGKSLPIAVLDELDSLDAKDRAYIFLDLMNYVYAKRKAIENSYNIPDETMEKFQEVAHLSDEELIKIVNE